MPHYLQPAAAIPYLLQRLRGQAHKELPQRLLVAHLRRRQRLLLVAPQRAVAHHLEIVAAELLILSYGVHGVAGGVRCHGALPPASWARLGPTNGRSAVV